MRWFKAFGGLLVLVLLATGCLRVENEISIGDDGSGTVSQILAVNPEQLVEIANETGQAAGLPLGNDAICGEIRNEFREEDPEPGTTYEDYDRDGFCGVSSSFALPASLDHSAFLTDRLGEEITLREQDGFWIFQTRPDLSDVNDLLGDSGGLLPADEFQELAETMQVRYVLDLPGVAVDGQTNATSIESNGRFVWEVDLLNPPDRFFAQTQPGSDGGGSLGLILIIVAVVLALAALAWFLMNRNKSDSSGPPPGLPGTTDLTPGGPPGLAQMPPPNQAAQPQQPVVPDPVSPSNPSARETIAMTPQQSAQAAAELAGGGASAPAPTYDEGLGAWVMDDPTRGRLIHDPETDSWRPA